MKATRFIITGAHCCRSEQCCRSSQHCRLAQYFHSPQHCYSDASLALAEETCLVIAGKPCQ